MPERFVLKTFKEVCREVDILVVMTTITAFAAAIANMPQIICIGFLLLGVFAVFQTVIIHGRGASIDEESSTQ